MIVKKIKVSYNIDTNSQLADYFQISAAAIDSWKRQNKVPEKYLFKCVNETGVSLDWLMDEDKPTFHISGGSKNISQVNGSVNQGSDIKTEDELDLFEEFKKMENLAKMANKVDFLKDELAKIKEKLKQYI
ncbi:helix-turn-helix domain-containing protein [Halarcobacter ebronensis]|uniref:helix-turn-helix domain-containing protein n=1 Tax=Halarcobacter ebronensis TaxID=1462615 RepID=UPI0013E962ED|nr:helix-turn-helix domain-containing protein [Halarcobacter ebronensis]